MAEKNWKNHLLKSGLPFEYEVKECFVNHHCTVWDEYSYIRTDENNLEKEFSYDIDVNYWAGNNSFTLMVECKYKTEPTKWFFLPDPYSYQSDITQNSFLHTIDYFKKSKFLFCRPPFDKVQYPLGPYCLKGVEIYQNQFLEVNIFKAINQLSFAFVDQVIQSFQSQLEQDTFYQTNFFNIPIIITNAELYLINEKLTTVDIEKAEDIDDISKKEDFLMFHNKIGEGLKRHNQIAISNYFTSIGTNLFKERNHSFSEDLPHFINVLSQHYCPEIILIMHHDKFHSNYKKLFDYIDFMIKPSDKLSQAMSKVKEELEAKMKNFKDTFPYRK
jgi:hypothetical protein